MYQELLDQLREALPGSHITIAIYPSGGIIEIEDCEECGDKQSSTMWRYHKGQSIDTAIAELRRERK